MLILHKVNTKDSFEISWIYDRGEEGFILKVSKAKGRLKAGDKITLGHYSPKLNKKISSVITYIETNSFNSDVSISLRNKKDIGYFKKTLCQIQ